MISSTACSCISLLTVLVIASLLKESMGTVSVVQKPSSCVSDTASAASDACVTKTNSLLQVQTSRQRAAAEEAELPEVPHVQTESSKGKGETDGVDSPEVALEKWDKDGDGKLSLEEGHGALAAYGVPEDVSDKIKHLFNGEDQDHDHLLDLNEIRKLMQDEEEYEKNEAKKAGGREEEKSNGDMLQVHSNLTDTVAAPQAKAVLPVFLVPVLTWAAGKLLSSAVGRMVQTLVTMSLPGDSIVIINLDRARQSRAFVNPATAAAWPDHVAVNYGDTVLLDIHPGDSVRVYDSLDRQTVYDCSGGECYNTYHYTTGEQLCGNEPVLSNHIYVWTGGSDCTGLKTTRNMDWQAENMIETYCMGDTADQVRNCVEFLGCAMENIYWFETGDYPRPVLQQHFGSVAPVYRRGSTYRVPGTTTCVLIDSDDPDAWRSRPGVRGGNPQCWQTPVGWCGRDGRCCRHPGVWPFWNGDRYGNGCRWSGCVGYHCCVAK